MTNLGCFGLDVVMGLGGVVGVVDEVGGGGLWVGNLGDGCGRSKA